MKIKFEIKINDSPLCYFGEDQVWKPRKGERT